MKRIRTKKKLIAMNMGILMLVSMLVYPIFASNTVDDSVEVVQEDNELTESNQIEEPEEITTPINEQEKEVENNAPIVTNVQPRATVGTEFTANIINNGVENLPCKFEVLTPASNGNPGTVKVANGLYTGFWISSIDKNNTTGTIAFPDTVSDGTDSYIITEIGKGSFGGCTKITSTGLANNTTITSVGEQAYDGCTGLQSTGLENNSTVKSLNSTFSGCTGLQSTGLEKNNTVTSTYLAFDGCTGLQSTGLENNRTIKEVGLFTFRGCTGLQSTGLENNSTVTSLEAVFEYCTGLKSTGLENNSTVTYLDTTFYGCTGLQSTGLENNSTVTRLISTFGTCTGLQSTGLKNNSTVTEVFYAFKGCTGLQSTGLENNSTVTSIEGAFKECSNLDDIVFEITTLPPLASNAFDSTGVNIYYLPETTNPEVLNNSGATSINKMAITNIAVNSGPTKTTYIEEQEFDPTGLVLDITYDKIGTKQRGYTDSNFASYFGFDKTELNYGDKSITVTYLDQTVTIPITVNKKSVTEVSIKQVPNKIAYIEEENFDPTGLMLTVNYDNGKSEDIIYNDSTKGNFSFDKTEVKLGNKSIAITYGGKSTTQAITVAAKTITGMEIKKEPTKVNYIEGQIWNPKGLVITVHYDNGKSEDITYNDSTKGNFGFDKKELALVDSAITISYGGKTVTQNITVVKKVLTGIKVKTAPKKTNYIEEEMFDPTGLVITTIYNDEIEETVVYNDSTKGDFDFNKTEVVLKDKSIEITYGGKSTTQAITVKEKSVIDIKVKTEPTKLEYQEGEVFSLEGLILEVAYNNGSKEEVIYDENTKDMFIYNQNELTPKDTKVAVEYQGKKIEIEIKVNDIPEIDVPDSDKTITSSTVDTKDSTIINEFIILLGISLVGIWFIKYRKKVKIV